MKETNWEKRFFILCWIAYFASYLGRSAFSAAMPEILQTTDWSKTVTGLIGTGFFICYGAGQLINGVIGDKVSPTKLIGTGLMGSAILNFLIGFANNPYYMMVLWCANGYFLSMLWSPIIKCFAIWFRPETRIKAGVNVSTTMPLGTLCSFGLTAALLSLWGWRAAFSGAGIAVFVAALLWIFLVSGPKKALEAARKTTEKQEAALPISQRGAPQETVSFFKLAMLSGMFFVAVGVMFNGVIKDGVTMWVPTYISEYFKLDSVAAILSSTVLPITNLAGVYVASYLNNKWIKNEVFTAAAMFGSGLVTLACLSLFGKYNVFLAVPLLAMTTSAMLGTNTMLISIYPMYFSKQGKTATVTGFLNCFTYIGSAVASYGIGAIAEAYGWDTTVWWWCAIALVGAVICIFTGLKWKKYRAIA